MTEHPATIHAHARAVTAAIQQIDHLNAKHGAKSAPTKVVRVERFCSCGFTSNWPAAWARHAGGSCNGHETKTQQTPKAKATTVTGCTTCKTKAADGTDGLCHQCRIDAATPAPEVETTDTEKCENCPAPATQHDIEGVPLCDDCMAITIVDNVTADLEAEDEHEKLEARAEHYKATPEQEITERANRLLGQSMAGYVVSERIPTHIAKELIDVRLRLVTSSLETTGSTVSAALRCSIEENVDRVRELVATLAPTAQGEAR